MPKVPSGESSLSFGVDGICVRSMINQHLGDVFAFWNDMQWSLPLAINDVYDLTASSLKDGFEKLLVVFCIGLKDIRCCVEYSGPLGEVQVVINESLQGREKQVSFTLTEVPPQEELQRLMNGIGIDYGIGAESSS